MYMSITFFLAQCLQPQELQLSLLCLRFLRTASDRTPIVEMLGFY